jgi:prepilin-type N-terminal cleavage/methylation domain-containing protein
MQSTSNRGFTLIELLVVIAIIGILSSVVLASLNSARQKGRDARRISDLKQLQLALELNYDAAQTYPLASSTLVSSGYISTLPNDPSLGTGYGYNALTQASADCTATPCAKYILWANVEGTKPAGAPTVDLSAVGGVNCSLTAAGTNWFCALP